MITAKVIEKGGTQEVIFPMEFRLQDDEVYANKIGDAVVLLPIENGWAGFLAGLNLFADDFMNDGRAQKVD